MRNAFFFIAGMVAENSSANNHPYSVALVALICIVVSLRTKSA